MVETPLHPSARKRQQGRLLGEMYLDLSQLNDSFRLLGERVLIAQYSMMAFQHPLSLITLSGV